MKYFFSFIFIFLFTFQSFANDGYKTLINSIEKDIVSYDTKIALKKIDSVLVKDFNTLSKKDKITFEVLKIETLTKANLFNESLALSNKILSEKELTIKQKVRVLLNNALAYEYVGNFKDCKTKLDKVTKIFNDNLLEKNNYYGIFLYRTSSFYRVQGQREKAFEFAKKAKDFSIKNNYKNESAVASMLLGFLNAKSDSKLAEKHFNTGLKFWKDVKDEHGISGMYMSLARIESSKKNFKKALKYCDSAIHIEKNTERFSSLAYVYSIKSRIFEKMNLVDSVVKTLKKNQEFSEKSKLYDQEIKVNELTYNYEIEKEKVKKQQVLRDLDDQKKRGERLFFTIVILVGLLSTILSLYLRNIIKNKKIKQQQLSLDKVNKELSSTVDEKSILLKELHHRVKNNLSMILSLINLQSNKLENKADKKLFEDLEKRINTIAITHNEFLYNETNNEYSLKNYIDKVVNQLVSLSANDIKINEDIENITISLDTALPIGFIINELITNSLKHSKSDENLEINIQISEQNDKILMEYFDNGKPTKTIKNKESLGLFLIDGMVAQLNGEYQETNYKYNFILNKK